MPTSDIWQGRVVQTRSSHSTVVLPVAGTRKHRALCSCGWKSAAGGFYTAYGTAKEHVEQSRWKASADG